MNYEKCLNFYFKRSNKNDRIRSVAKFTPYVKSCLLNVTPTFESRIPVCFYCGAHANCYNTYSDNTMTCCICGKTTKIGQKNNEIEYKDPIYVTNLSRLKSNLENFQPTEYFILSKSIIDNKPSVIKTIIASTERSSTFKQNGIAIFHGAISFLQFVPNLSMHTISDMSDSPSFITEQMFCGSLVFKYNVEKAFQRIKEIKKSGESSTASILDFCIAVSKSIPSVFNIFLDSEDYKQLQNDKRDFTSLADNLLSLGSKVSFTVFDEDKSYHPCFETAVVTGGYVNFIKDKSDEEIFSIIRPTLDENVVYNCRIEVKTSGQVNEFSGHGLTNGKGEHLVGIAKHEEPFFVDFDILKGSFYVQFSFVYSTVLSFHQMMIVTVDLNKVLHNHCIINEYMETYIKPFALKGEIEMEKAVREFKKDWEITEDKIIPKLTQNEHKIEV